MSGLYQKLLQFASLTFTPKDILGFLGRKWDRRFNGDVQTEVKTDRILGTRIKHRMTRNWLKMYDKFGLILRVETVINRPREFFGLSARATPRRDGTTSGRLLPDEQGCRQPGAITKEQALACNRRYLDAPVRIVDDPRAGVSAITATHRAKESRGPQFLLASIRFSSARTFACSAAVLDGDHIARGFRKQGHSGRARFTGSATPTSTRHSAGGGSDC